MITFLKYDAPVAPDETAGGLCFGVPYVEGRSDEYGGTGGVIRLSVKDLVASWVQSALSNEGVLVEVEGRDYEAVNGSLPTIQLVVRYALSQ